jgi:hypothetical protein
MRSIRQSRPTGDRKMAKCLPISRNVVINDIYCIYLPIKTSAGALEVN